MTPADNTIRLRVELDGKNLLELSDENERPWGGLAFSESYGLKTVIKDGRIWSTDSQGW